MLEKDIQKERYSRFQAAKEMTPKGGPSFIRAHKEEARVVAPPPPVAERVDTETPDPVNSTKKIKRYTVIMTKTSIIAIASFLLLLTIGAFIAGFIVSKSIHEHKNTAPHHIIHQAVAPSHLAHAPSSPSHMGAPHINSPAHPEKASQAGASKPASPAVAHKAPVHGAVQNVSHKTVSHKRGAKNVMLAANDASTKDYSDDISSYGARFLTHGNAQDKQYAQWTAEPYHEGKMKNLPVRKVLYDTKKQFQTVPPKKPDPIPRKNVFMAKNNVRIFNTLAHAQEEQKRQQSLGRKVQIVQKYRGTNAFEYEVRPVVSKEGKAP